VKSCLSEETVVAPCWERFDSAEMHCVPRIHIEAVEYPHNWNVIRRANRSRKPYRELFSW
jgi:hypothetical protein